MYSQCRWRLEILPPLFAEDYEASALRYNIEYQPASRHCFKYLITKEFSAEVR